MTCRWEAEAWRADRSPTSGVWRLAAVRREVPSVDTPWASGPAFVTAPVTAASVHQVVLVYDADADNFEGFLDGVSMGSI